MVTLHCLQSIRRETDNKVALIGFIGAPWTLAAYSVEGSQSKFCARMKQLCNDDPVLAHQLLIKYTTSLCNYASYQVRPQSVIYLTVSAC